MLWRAFRCRLSIAFVIPSPIPIPGPYNEGIWDCLKK